MSDLIRCPALNNIPSKKLQDCLMAVEKEEADFKIKNTKLMAINRYAETNIPLEYWPLKMESSFAGDPRLLKRYEEYTADLKQTYINGKSICFAGQHGVGKSLTATCILKKACLKGYSCLYTDLSSVIAILTQAPNEEKYAAKRELQTVDYLTIDEVDPRFFAASNTSNELFIKNLENILRTRIQNKLPTILCTNSPNLLESFTGQLKLSMESLFNKIEMFAIWGEDFRKKLGDGTK